MSAKQQKRPHVIIFNCVEITRNYRRIVKRKYGQYSHISAFFGKIGPFSNFQFQEKIISK